MAQVIDLDVSASSREGGDAPSGWLCRAAKRFLAAHSPAAHAVPRERNDDGRDPPDLPPTWYLT